MDYPNRDIFLSRPEQDRIRKMLGPVTFISEYLGKAADYLKEGKDWVKSLTEAAPWLKDAGEVAGAGLPIVGAAVKLFEKWLEQTHPYELGAVACTLAYQQAVQDAINAVWTSPIGFQDANKIDDKIAKKLKESAPAEEADLSTFTYDSAMQHPFVRRADELLGAMMQASGFTEEQQTKVFNIVHDKFVKNLQLLLSDKRTADKFAPFKDWIELGAEKQQVHLALQIHAKYQVAQYATDPLFKREPFALKDVYAETECGELRWGEVRRAFEPKHAEITQSERCDPFSENFGGRQDLLTTVMDYITGNKDKKFNDAIVIQGVAGAGKSSFTLRLCAELWEKGFHPIRIRFKKLRLGASLIESINEAIELADEERLEELSIAHPKNMLLDGNIFNTPYGGNRDISRYVLILDGWDELDLSDNKTFREKVKDVLLQVRHTVLNKYPRVRVVVTGRPSNDVTESAFLRDDTPLLTLRSLRPGQLRDFVDRLKRSLEKPTIEVEDRDPWSVPDLKVFESVFKKYEEEFENSLPKKDEKGATEPSERSLSSEMDVLGLPLLAYLTIRLMSQAVDQTPNLDEQQKLLDQLIEQPSRLYRHLVDMTCEKAGKASIDERDRPDEITRQEREVGDALRKRLRRTAAAMSVCGVEFISFEEWQARMPKEEPKAGIGQIISKTDPDNHPLTKLMISFYFKGGHREQGCEFAHKSFREYLFAECIVEALKDFGRAFGRKVLEVSAKRTRYWRDFSRTEDSDLYKFSRELSELLAPQWLTPEVVKHLEELIAWEIGRSQTKQRELKSGLTTEVLPFERWERVRDGLADLWAWWVDGAHLRPQIHSPEERGENVKIDPPYAHKLIRWSAPQAGVEDEDLPLDGVNTIDAHLGDGLFRLCTMVHFYVAINDGLILPSAIKDDNEERLSPDEFWKGGSEIGKGPRPFQTAISVGSKPWVVFAPSGLDHGQFNRCIARINGAAGRPDWEFPGQVQGSLIDLRLASLDRARLYGASLDGARLDGARLDRADLSDARKLTWDQIESAHIDEDTKLPAEFEERRLDKLKRQREKKEKKE